jgi:hypothetical protein
MAANVELIDIGEVKVEPRREGGEWFLLYTHPEDKRKMGNNFRELNSVYGAGRGHKKVRDALCGLAATLRKEGYTGTVKNMKPSRVKRGGDAT